MRAEVKSALGWRRSGDSGAAAEEPITERLATHRSRDGGSHLPSTAALRGSSSRGGWDYPRQGGPCRVGTGESGLVLCGGMELRLPLELFKE